MARVVLQEHGEELKVGEVDGAGKQGADAKLLASWDMRNLDLDFCGMKNNFIILRAKSGLF